MPNIDKYKIAVDGGPLKSGDSIRGIGVYTSELTKKLGINTVDVFLEDLSRYQIVHFTRFNPFFRAFPSKKPQGVKFVLTLYDLIPLIYPEIYKPGLKGSMNWQINKYNIVRNCDAVITISETSKKDICRFTGVDPNKVFVTHLAPRSIFKKMKIDDTTKSHILKKYGLPDKFVLYVGDVNFNKNIPTLVSACNKYGVKLAIAGKQVKEIENMDLNHPELAHLKNIAWKDVARLGFVEDSELSLLYNLAYAYIQPSLYEGFGLPVLEAMACGCPVVSSRTQTLVEISGDTCLYADPDSVEEFAKCLKALEVKQTRDKVVKQQSSWLTKFNWQKTAADTLNVYEKLLR